MTEPEVDLRRNAEATQRLRELVARLDDGDLGRSLGGNWTVAVALTHLAFWDSFQAAALRDYAAGRAFPSADGEAATNAALETIVPLVDPKAIGRAAVHAAEQADAAVTELTPDRRTALLGSEHAYAIRRWSHREEHLAQIEAGSG